jgi:hypothetical protein
VKREWFRFLQNLYVLTGSGGDPTTTQDLQMAPPESLSADLFALSSQQAKDALLAPYPLAYVSQYRYGAYYNLNNQTAAVINTGYATVYPTTIAAKGVTQQVSGQLKVDRPGVYNIEATINANKTTAGTANLFLWFAKNGTNQTGSAIVVPLTGGGIPVTVLREYLLPLNAGDYVSLMWSASSTDVILASVAASGPVPDIPSSSISVYRTGDI